MDRSQTNKKDHMAHRENQIQILITHTIGANKVISSSSHQVCWNFNKILNQRIIHRNQMQIKVKLTINIQILDKERDYHLIKIQNQSYSNKLILQIKPIHTIQTNPLSNHPIRLTSPPTTNHSCLNNLTKTPTSSQKHKS